MGHEISAKTLRARLPQDQWGRVNPKRVGVAKLDKMVELHLMAVPFTDSITRLGVACMGSGVSFVNTAKPVSMLVATSAHEGAHSLGFVRKDALQRDIHDPGHCCSANCVLHKVSSRLPWLSDIEEHEVVDGLTFIHKLKKVIGASGDMPTTEEPTLSLDDDFCRPCQADLASFGDQHLASLRMSRLAVGKVTRNQALIFAT